MKKVFILAIIAGAFSFTSCKKDYTCECKTSSSSAVVPTTIPKAKKADAEKACETLNATYAIGGGSCTLK